MSPANSPRGNSLGALLGKQSLSCGVVGNTSDFGSEALGSNPGSSTRNEIEQRLDGSNPPGTCVSVAQRSECCSIKIQKARDF